MIKPNFTRRDDGFEIQLKSLKFYDASQNCGCLLLVTGFQNLNNGLAGMGIGNMWE